MTATRVGRRLIALSIILLLGVATLDEIGTSRGTANFSIRGLGVNSSIPSIDPTVGVFVDGVYMGTNAMVLYDTFDLEAVEVLRGPQGVLFGRNVVGGGDTQLPTALGGGTFSPLAKGRIFGLELTYHYYRRLRGVVAFGTNRSERGTACPRVAVLYRQ